MTLHFDWPALVRSLTALSTTHPDDDREAA